MRGLFLSQRNLTFRTDLPMPCLLPGEALIRVRMAGICATDLELVRGYYPFNGIPGHEFVGVVERAPDAPHWEGRRVVGEINAACGACPQCRQGRPTHCEERSVLGILGRDGAFAEFLCLPLANLHPVPDDLPDEKAVFTEPLAAALEIQQQVHLRPTDRVLVVGAGRLGQLIAWTLALCGCDLRVVARHKAQRELLARRGIRAIGAEQVPHWGMDVVVEATGAPAGFALAKHAVRPRGVIVLKSTYAGDLRLDMSRIVVDEVTLVGSRCGPFAPALAHLQRGLIDPGDLLVARYPLEKGLAAFAHAAQPGVFKVAIAMQRG